MLAARSVWYDCLTFGPHGGLPWLTQRAFQMKNRPSEIFACSLSRLTIDHGVMEFAIALDRRAQGERTAPNVGRLGGPANTLNMQEGWLQRGHSTMNRQIRAHPHLDSSGCAAAKA